jgi:hypothetical protein
MSKARGARLALAAGALAAVVLPAPAHAANLYLDAAAGSPPTGMCSSAANACQSFSQAIPQERSTPEIDTIHVAPGVYAGAVQAATAADNGLTIVGSGSGSDTAVSTVLFGQVKFGGSNQEALRDLRVAIPTGSSVTGIDGMGASVSIANVVVDMQDSSSTADGIRTQQGAGLPPSTLDSVSVGGAWKGRALEAFSDVTIRDSTFTSPPANTSHTATFWSGTALVQRSSFLTANTGSGAASVLSNTNATIDSSLLLGGQYGVEGEYPGSLVTTTIVGSTIDAGVRGVRDGGSVEATAANGTAIILRGSITADPQMTDGTGTVSCTSSDVPDQSPGGPAGAVDCGHAAGNVTAASLSDLFVDPGVDYRLKPTASAVDALPESAVPGATSTTDRAGAPRVVDGNLDCIATRDRGAFELQGRSNTRPVASASAAPPFAVKGSPVGFSGSATDEDPPAALGYSWAFSDGASAPGASVSHAFGATGPATAALTVTDSHGCTGTASAAVAVADIELSEVSASNASFRPRLLAPAKATPPRSTRFRYSLNEPATVTFSIQRRAPKKKWKKAGSIVAAGVAGANSTPFKGVIKSKKLVAGKYRALVTAVDSFGNHSAQRTVAFKIVH